MASTAAAYGEISAKEYRRRIRAWTMYDWANSAFATTILAAVLPIYYSQVAGATLPSPAVATAYWSTGLSISLFIVAILSPILGTVSDVMRGKKRFLSIFVGLGVLATGLLVLVDTGDWLLASILFIFGRIGFTAANVFYDALLPHVAREEDRDIVSTRGYAMGYLGGGLLLAINILMIQLLPGTWGPRLSFLSVAIWWAVFSIPIFTRVPEPPAATGKLAQGLSRLQAFWEIVRISFGRLRDTLADIRQYSELFKFLLAFLIYNDGIGTIIGVAAIYGAELGFGSIELILALLLVQFVGIPFSLIFGRLPSPKEPRRALYLSFVLFNVLVLPVLGIMGSRLLPPDLTGAPQPPFQDTARAHGQGSYPITDPAFEVQGPWQEVAVSTAQAGTEEDVPYLHSSAEGAQISFPFNGQKVEIFYSAGPDRGIWGVLLDGQPLLDPDSGQPLEIDAYHPTVRYGLRFSVQADSPGEHVLTLVNTGRANPKSQGTLMSLAQVNVLPPIRQSNLGALIGGLFALQLVSWAFAWLVGRHLTAPLAARMSTKAAILLALAVYAVIASWGFFLDSVIEFWFLAWMVAMVQGGSQALSRSLYASLSPASKSGEFFGLFGIMEKFSAIAGPLIFAAAVSTFNSSRPAVLSVVIFFLVGAYLLTRVDVQRGQQVAREEDALYLAGES
jgi:UMF1 family MFS transporter